MERRQYTDRKRSARACRECHGGKMKCDVAVVGSPCTRCKQRGIAKCEVFPSKRGKYERRKKIGTMEPRPDLQETMINKESTISTELLPNSQALVYSPGPESLMLAHRSLSPIDTFVTSLSTFNNNKDSQDKGSNELSVATAETNRRPVPSPNQHRETWELSIKSKEKAELCFRRERIAFLGETSPLSMLLRKMTDSGHIEILLPEEQQHVASSESSLRSSPTSVSENSIKLSSTAHRLSKHSLELFLEAYFTYVHPFYPIVDRKWFARHYTRNSVPDLLLNAICFAACYHCHLSTIYDAKFASLEAAKNAFYEDAKLALVGRGQAEPGVAIQCAILLSFQGAGTPGDVWNTGTWLGLAVSMAEDHGLHRSTLKSNLNKKDKQLFKIIWWVLVFRDTMTSLTLGRPNKISMQDCDVDMLNLDDFTHDFDPQNGETIFGRRDEMKHKMLIEFCKLNVLMGDLTRAKYKLRQTELSSLSEVQQRLADWRMNIPPELDWKQNPHNEEAMYLNMLYQHVIIYMYRPKLADSDTLEDCSLDRTVQAASEIAVIVGKLGMKNILAIPQDVYSIFVTAMVVLAVDIRSKHQKGVPSMSSMQLQICMLTLNQALEHWDQAPWVVKMFEKLQSNLVETSTDNNIIAASPNSMEFENYGTNTISNGYLEDYFDLLQTVITN